MTVRHLHTKKAMVGNHSGDTFGVCCGENYVFILLNQGKHFTVPIIITIWHS